MNDGDDIHEPGEDLKPNAEEAKREMSNEDFCTKVEDLSERLSSMATLFDRSSEMFAKEALQAKDEKARSQITELCFDLMQAALQLETTRNQIVRIACRLGYFTLEGTTGARTMTIHTKRED